MKKNYVCTWCNQQVAEENFDLHSAEHYVKQAQLMKTNPSTTVTSVASVSYVQEGLA